MSPNCALRIGDGIRPSVLVSRSREAASCGSARVPRVLDHLRNAFSQLCDADLTVPNKSRIWWGVTKSARLELRTGQAEGIDISRRSSVECKQVPPARYS